jgi:hypothetical protein
MAGNTRALCMLCCLTAAGTALPCEAKVGDADPIVMVRLENPKGFAGPELARAQELATEIYRQAGVALRWTPDETIAPDRTLTLVLTSSTAVRPGLGRDALGVAPSPGDGTRGTLAYVFLGQVNCVDCRSLPSFL